ncbi:MAG: hypothetical protein U5L11_04935 [Arhodomonas sp.]|nr:hypothetical protein [Arhodomonas sp.]
MERLQLRDPSPHAGSSPVTRPILAIWETNTEDETVRPVDLHAGGVTAMVTRPHLHLANTALPAGAAPFVEALAADHSLPVAARAVTDGDFDFATTLQTLLSAGAVTDFRIDPETQGNNP